MSLPDPLHLIIALTPLALYLLPLAVTNLSRRPKMTTGARDLAALGVGIMGFVFAGPMELFMPEVAASRWQGLVWVLLILLYGLTLSLLVMLTRPRLIIYNMTLDQLRPILADVVAELDQEARWAGDNLVLPELSIQLHLEQSSLLRTAQLIATGSTTAWQSHETFEGWNRLATALNAKLKQTQVMGNPFGVSLLLASVTLFGFVAFLLYQAPQEIAQSLRLMLMK